MLFEEVGPFLASVLAVSLGAACVVAALIERPPASRLPRAVVVLAACWSLVFVAAAALTLDRIALAGLLAAAAAVCAAGAIWAARSPEGGGGGGPGPDDPPSMPPEFWDRWEAELEAARLSGASGR